MIYLWMNMHYMGETFTVKQLKHFLLTFFTANII